MPNIINMTIKELTEFSNMIASQIGEAGRTRFINELMASRSAMFNQRTGCVVIKLQ